ncbi:hypothetical protein Gohar_011629, partial [Gossypium harknessii]|nr:hypothetical protein [Gossypium harknessii]
MLSEPVPQPVTENVTYGGGDLLDFLDQSFVDYHGPATDHKPSTSQDGRPQDSATQKYINCVKFFGGQRMERKLNFLEAMKLEIERLHLNISAAERDRALLCIGIDPATVNPNFLLDESYIGRLCRIASTLALLGQAALEDKINGAIGLGNIEDNVIDYWNISRIGDYCAGGKCEVRAETKATRSDSSALPSTEGSKSIFLCSQCRSKACQVCSAGRGALLLPNYSRDTMNYNGLSNQVGLTTNRSEALDSVICRKCCHEIILDALVLDYVRVLISSRRKVRADSAAHKALDEVTGSSFLGSLSERSESSGNQRAAKVLKQLLNREASLAEFPFASFLHSVETATDSAPLLSLLTPLYSGSPHSYWKAPPNTTSVEFVTVLGTLSDVSGVVLLVSPCGYSEADAPLVQIWASNKIDREGRSCVGKWDVQSLISSSPEFYGPEKSTREDKLPRHIKFTFKNPIRCRIVWITLRLQRPGSSSVNFGNDFSLLSLDENPFAQETRRASFGGATESSPCLHAKRIVIAGIPVKKEMEFTSSESSDQRNWLDRAPQLNRFKVPIEAERLMDYDLVLEQYLPPSSPLLAGFRLDAFNAIKPRITHSPTSDTDIWDTSETFLEDRHISPAVLYIQVSALQ